MGKRLPLGKIKQAMHPIKSAIRGAILLAWPFLCGGFVKAAPEIAASDLYILSVGAEPWLGKSGERDLYGYDAQFVGQALVAAAPLHKSIHSRVLTGKNANPGQVTGGVRWMAENMKAGDLGIVFFSTHGTTDKKKGFYNNLYPGEGEKESGKLLGKRLNAELGKCAGRMLVWVDACEAGGLITASGPTPPNTSYFLASTREESSYGQSESMDRPHGHFVAALCDGLRGFADEDRDGAVTVAELAAYMPIHTKKLEPLQTCVFLIREGHKGIALARVDTHAMEPHYRGSGKARNPFGLNDVADGYAESAMKFAARTKLTGDDQDANAQAWDGDSPAGKYQGLDGDWQCRWNDGGNPGEWIKGKATIKTVDGKVFIRTEDSSGVYLMELARLPGDLLVGCYLGQKSPLDTSSVAGRIVSERRIDAAYDGGRWDFRR